MNRRPTSKTAAVAALGFLGISIIAGGYKRHAEKSMPVNYPPAACEEIINSASNIQIREIPFSLGNSYNIVVNGERVGTIDEIVLHWGKRFDFYAGTPQNGRYLGKAEEKILSIGHQSTVYDRAGNVIGKLDEKLLTLNPGHVIEVFDEHGSKIAVSDERVIAMTHETTLYDGAKRRIIGDTTKGFYWDNYTLNVTDPSIDKKLLLALVAMEDKLEDEAAEDDKDDEEEDDDDDSSDDSSE